MCLPRKDKEEEICQEARPEIEIRKHEGSVKYNARLTFKVSGCMCPSIGRAPAARILGGTLEGPGPINSFWGTIIGKRSSFGELTAMDLFPIIVSGSK